jgi:hypothetical protein
MSCFANRTNLSITCKKKSIAERINIEAVNWYTYKVGRGGGG